MDESDLKIIEIRVKNLMLSKHLIVQTLTVIIGGIAGLGFMPNTGLKYFLIIAGALFAIIFINNYQDVNQEINRYLYRNKNK